LFSCWQSHAFNWIYAVNEILCSGETEVHFGIEKETGQ
jgi:hypothetical protein